MNSRDSMSLGGRREAAALGCVRRVALLRAMCEALDKSVEIVKPAKSDSC